MKDKMPLAPQTYDALIQTRKEGARAIGVASGTFTRWLNGTRRQPPDLAERLERALQLPAGALSEVTP